MPAHAHACALATTMLSGPWGDRSTCQPLHCPACLTTLQKEARPKEKKKKGPLDGLSPAGKSLFWTLVASLIYKYLPMIKRDTPLAGCWGHPNPNHAAAIMSEEARQRIVAHWWPAAFDRVIAKLVNDMSKAGHHIKRKTAQSMVKK